MSKGNCDCCERKDVELRHAEVCGIETYACAVCHGYPADEFDEPPCTDCGASAEENCKPGCPSRGPCTCRMESVNTASIDPPELILDRDCPRHGSPRDPDVELERQRDDAAFDRDMGVGDEF